MTSTSAELLRQAADKIRTLATAVEAPALPDQSWHVEECADDERGNCPCIVAQGRYDEGPGPATAMFYVADAETPELAGFIATLHPGVAVALAAVFEAWARMGEMDPDLLNRVGGRETVAAARAVLGVPDPAAGP